MNIAKNDSNEFSQRELFELYYQEDLEKASTNVAKTKQPEKEVIAIKFPDLCEKFISKVANSN